MGLLSTTPTPLASALGGPLSIDETVLLFDIVCSKQHLLNSHLPTILFPQHCFNCCHYLPRRRQRNGHLLCHPLLPDGMPVRFDRASSPTAPALLPSLPSAPPSSQAAGLWVASSAFAERPLAVPSASARAHRHCFATAFQIPCLFSLWGLMVCETINHPPSSSGGFKAQATAKFSSSTAKCHSSHLLSFQLPKATVCICQCHLVSLNSSLSPFGSIVINNKWSVGGCRSKHTPVNLHFKLWAADF